MVGPIEIYIPYIFSRGNHRNVAQQNAHFHIVLKAQLDYNIFIIFNCAAYFIANDFLSLLDRKII